MAAAVAGGGVVSMVKFRPPLGVDSILKGAVSVRTNTRHMCITAMDAYDNSSLEELRLAHYDRLRSFIGIPPAPRFSTPQNAWANPGGTDQQGHASPRNPFSVIGNPGCTFINAARRLRKEHTKTHHDNKQQGTCTKATNTMVTTDSLLSERMDVLEQRVAHLEVTSRSGGEADRPASNHVTTKCTPEPKRDAKCELGDGISDKMIGQSGTLLLFKNENRLHQYMGQRNIKLANVHVFFSDKTRTVALMVNPNNSTWNSSANMLSNGIRREKWRTAGSSASSSAPPMEGMADLNVDVTRPKSHHSTWSTSPSRREPSKGEGISNASSSAYARRLQWTVGEGSTPGSGVQGDGAPRGEDRRPIWTEEDTRCGTSASAESSDDDAEADDYFGPLLRAAEELRDSVRGRDVFALGPGTDRRLDILSRWADPVSGSPVTHVPVPAKVTNFEVTNAEVTRAKGTNAKMTDCTEINNKTMDEKVTKSDAMVTVQEQRDSVRSRGIVSTEPSVNRRLQILGRLADLISGSSITHVEASKSDLELRFAHYKALPGRVEQQSSCGGYHTAGFAPFIGFPTRVKKKKPVRKLRYGNEGRSTCTTAPIAMATSSKATSTMGTITMATSTVPNYPLSLAGLPTTGCLLRQHEERIDDLENRVAHLEVTSRSRGEPDRPTSNHVTTGCSHEPRRDAKCELGDDLVGDKMIGECGTLLLFNSSRDLDQYINQNNIKPINVDAFFSDKTGKAALSVHLKGSLRDSSREKDKEEVISNGASSANARPVQWTGGEGSTAGSGVQGDGAPRGEDRRPIRAEEDTRCRTSASAETSDDDAEADDYFGPLLRAAEKLRDSVRGRDVFALGQGTDRRLNVLSRWADPVSGSPVTHVPVPAKVTNVEVTNAEVTRAKGTSAKMTDCTEINNKTMDEKVTKNEGMVAVQERRDSVRS